MTWHGSVSERLVGFMGSVHEVIEAFRKAPSNSERGTKFEQLMVRYFELDPMLSQQYEKVWRWIDWPGRRGKPDTGIDLVARERDTGDYTAIQCKFYEPTHTLAKGDIDSFFTASGKTPFSTAVPHRTDEAVMDLRPARDRSSVLARSVHRPRGRVDVLLCAVGLSE